jgi:hypothetical protein
MATILFHHVRPVGDDDQLARSRRMRMLVVVIVALSAFDLAATLLRMRTTGMLEANPVVVALMHHMESGLALIAFKTLTVIIGAGVLHVLRGHRLAEAGAWLAVAILTAVVVLWIEYDRQTAHLDITDWSRIAEFDPGWVAIR